MAGLISYLEALDKDLFRVLNGTHNALFDWLMPWISNKYVWIPLYAFLLYSLIRYSKAPAWAVLLGIGLLILLSDQTASGLLKPWVERLRPCYDPELEGQVHLLKGCGGRYGFASSHASNSFAVAMFCWLLLKDSVRYIGWLFPWAALVAYSRVYLGVHFPGDILAGALIGIGSGVVINFILKQLTMTRWGKKTL
ncbi:phosphatase PAP2 family protein [Roseivirga sp. UBA1976]|uniref:phosphatase PAP2 family protein n=1 Tax=Roseivirga sp. UBA1976 TaxID=1947386 RepID=UPI00257BF325|nr:phosphatase PAP2 family protein [Roseivirga sp. UBA1976]MEC7754823.1 phosphatase PAP2 family protein [Bacteroidota bacterium]